MTTHQLPALVTDLDEHRLLAAQPVARGADRTTRRRTGQSRPGLPVDDMDPWTRSARTWADALERAGKAPAYVEGCLKHVGWLAGDHAPTVADPWQLTAAELSSWLDAQLWSITTRSHVLVSLRGFYAWGIRAGLLDRSPLSGLPSAPPRPPGPGRAHVPDAWAPAVDEWLTWLRSSARTEGTLHVRRTRVVSFAQDYVDPWAVTESDLARWLSRPDWAPSTKRSARSSLRSFYSWAHRRGLLPTDPTRDLGAIRQRRTLPRPAPDDAVRAALGAADDRVSLMLHLGLYAGLRIAEIAGLHTRDIGEDTLTVVGKGGHQRQVPLHPSLASMLRHELARRREATDLGDGWGRTVPPVDGWLFPSTDQDQHLTPHHAGKLVSRVAPAGWTAHTMRHRFATQAYQTERDLRAVQELLGHTKPETTARYAAVPTGALRAAVMGLALPEPTDSAQP